MEASKTVPSAQVKAYCWYWPVAQMSVHRKNWEQSEGCGK